MYLKRRTRKSYFNTKINIVKILNRGSFLSATVVQLVGDLAVDAPGAAPRGHGVLAGVALQTVLFTQLAPEEEERDAGRDAGEQQVEYTALAGPVGILAEQATSAECSAQA